LDSLAGLGCYESSGDEAPEACSSTTLTVVTDDAFEGENMASPVSTNAMSTKISRGEIVMDSQSIRTTGSPGGNDNVKGREARIGQPRSNGRQNKKPSMQGRGGAAYQYHGTIQRRGGTLLDKLLKHDVHRQDALLLQAIRLLVSSETL
jgi:hypothetical protein